MLEYWYDYAKQKYGGKANEFAGDPERRFDTSKYEVERPLLIAKSKKVIGLVKAKLGGKIMKEFLALRPKMYGSLTDDACDDKNAKGTKRCIINQELIIQRLCIIKQELIIQRLQKLPEN